MMPGWLWGLAWAVWMAGMVAVGGVRAGRPEYEADRRRVEGGTIYQDVVWEMLGEAERSLRRLLDLMIEIPEPELQRAIRDEIEAQQRNVQRLHRLLTFRTKETM